MKSVHFMTADEHIFDVCRLIFTIFDADGKQVPILKSNIFCSAVVLIIFAKRSLLSQKFVDYLKLMFEGKGGQLFQVICLNSHNFTSKRFKFKYNCICHESQL